MGVAVFPQFVFILLVLQSFMRPLSLCAFCSFLFSVPVFDHQSIIEIWLPQEPDTEIKTIINNLGRWKADMQKQQLRCCRKKYCVQTWYKTNNHSGTKGGKNYLQFDRKRWPKVMRSKQTIGILQFLYVWLELSGCQQIDENINVSWLCDSKVIGLVGI